MPRQRSGVEGWALMVVIFGCLTGSVWWPWLVYPVMLIPLLVCLLQVQEMRRQARLIAEMNAAGWALNRIMENQAEVIRRQRESFDAMREAPDASE